MPVHHVKVTFQVGDFWTHTSRSRKKNTLLELKCVQGLATFCNLVIYYEYVTCWIFWGKYFLLTRLHTLELRSSLLFFCLSFLLFFFIFFFYPSVVADEGINGTLCRNAYRFSKTFLWLCKDCEPAAMGSISSMRLCT